MQATTNGTLSQTPVRFGKGNAACVILASRGYPSHYEKGFPITVPADVWDAVYVAGAAEKDGEMVTSGGRVLGVTAVADTLEDAVRIAYERADRVEFENAYCRRDIGARALAALK
jgi:phosphoribosylamine--glycine ligase